MKSLPLPIRAISLIATTALLLLPLCLRAQVSMHVSPEVGAQLMVPQPPVNYVPPENIAVTAEFDPPMVRPGEKSFYRVTVAATQNTVRWPENITLPTGLLPGMNVLGQLTQPDGTPFHPLTEFVYETTAPATGHFSMPGFEITAGGQQVKVPDASLEVSSNAATPPARKLRLVLSSTNLFLGQPFKVRVILPATANNQVEALRDIQFNGAGFLADKFATHQSIEPVNVDGQLRPAFVYETVATPLAAGVLEVSAQAFTAGREFNGPITIRGALSLPGGPTQYVLLMSDMVKVRVQPLPAGEPAGFTGAMGKFFIDPPRLATNRLQVGQPVQMKVVFHGEGDLTRLVPPNAPRSHDWQILPEPAPSTDFTLVPLTDEATNTPAIPFSYFDPATASYVELAIPSLPVTVVGEGLPINVRLEQGEKSELPLKLSGLATAPGEAVSSLNSPQRRIAPVALQCAPLIGLLAAWQWNRRRLYLEAHPDIVRRRQARRQLRRERRKLEKAFAAHDAENFTRHAAAALCVAAAPHYPAQPQALVCGDVLAQLPAASNAEIETVRDIFAATDLRFAAKPLSLRGDWMDVYQDLQSVLQKLEARL